MNIKPRVRPYFMPVELDLACFWYCAGICTIISEGWGGVACIYGCRLACEDFVWFN
jgi:hypothetical protein